MSNEVVRGVRLTATSIQYVSFKLPRKSGNFSADLYPPCRSQNSSMSFEDYWSGQDKEYDRQEMKPD
jgi:hypothetical protein